MEPIQCHSKLVHSFERTFWEPSIYTLLTLDIALLPARLLVSNSQAICALFSVQKPRLHAQLEGLKKPKAIQCIERRFEYLRRSYKSLEWYKLTSYTFSSTELHVAA